MIKTATAIESKINRGLLTFFVVVIGLITIASIHRAYSVRTELETLAHQYLEKFIQSAVLRQDELAIQRETDRFSASFGSALNTDIHISVFRNDRLIARSGVVSSTSLWSHAKVLEFNFPSATYRVELLSTFDKLVRNWAVTIAFVLLTAGVLIYQTRNAIASGLTSFTDPLQALTEQVQSIALQVRQNNPGEINEKSNYHELEVLRASINSLLNRIQTLKGELVAVGLTAGRSEVAIQVVHDLKAPLAALKSLMSQSATETGDGKLGSLRNAVTRIEGISKEILQDTFEQLGSTEKGSCRLGAVVANAIATVRQSAPAGVSVGGSLPEDLREAELSFPEVRLERILVNLLSNAVDAVSAGGQVSVSALSRKGNVVIAVTDNGCGIPRDLVEKLGRKGFTFGKPNGTGLGLYFAKNAVETASGTFQILSEVGKGTTVEIGLPFQVGSKSFSSEIVLIDDDPLIHEVWRMSAASYGKKLFLFYDHQDFLTNLATIPKTTDVFIDCRLGKGVDGILVAKAVFRAGYENIYLATGLPREEVRAKLSELPVKGVIGKRPPWETNFLNG